jgi:hypothetical protein
LDLLSRQYLIDLNLNIFGLSHTIQVKNQVENIQERIESPLLLPALFLLKPNHKKEKNIKTGISEGANQHKIC